MSLVMVGSSWIFCVTIGVTYCPQYSLYYVHQCHYPLWTKPAIDMISLITTGVRIFFQSFSYLCHQPSMMIDSIETYANTSPLQRASLKWVSVKWLDREARWHFQWITPRHTKLEIGNKRHKYVISMVHHPEKGVAFCNDDWWWLMMLDNGC